MRIAIESASLLGARTGIGVFTANLVAGLAGRSDLDVVLFAASWRGRHELERHAPPGVATVSRPMAARPLRVAWRHSNFPPINYWTGPVDVVHGPNYVVPPVRGGAAVVSVHDLTFLDHPQWCTDDTLEYPALLRGAVARGAWVHTDTDAVRSEVIRVFDVDPDRVVTVPLAPSELPGADLPGADAQAGRELAGADRFVLALGTVEPRKDLPGLVAAFDEVAASDPGVHLVIAGPDGWGAGALEEAVAASPHGERIRRLGWVDTNARAALLRAATVLAYPSRYEGFGLPPLEAMAAGTPVVATDVPAVAETCADGALLVPPGDTNALAGALARVVANPEVAGDLARRGEARAREFTWERTVAGMAGLYRRAAGG